MSRTPSLKRNQKVLSSSNSSAAQKNIERSWGGSSNSANSGNCVIPKSVVDRLDVGLGGGREEEGEQERNSRARGAGGGGRGRMMPPPPPPAACSRIPQYQEPFPRVGSCVTSRQLQSAPPPPPTSFPSRFPPSPFPAAAMQHTTLAYLVISYLSIARGERASVHTYTRDA